MMIKIMVCIIAFSAYLKGWFYWLECMDGFVDDVVFKVLWWTVHMVIVGWIMKGVFL